MTKQRKRLVYALLIAAVIPAGLASRSSLAIHLPSFLATYAGDTLWSLTLFLSICFLFPGIRSVVAALLTVVISFSVEISQLYQADWINSIRGTRIGALFLGVGFKWSDLLCYTVGALMGLAGDLLRRQCPGGNHH